MIAYVADASALIKVVIEEPESAIVIRFFSSTTTGAPALLRVEAANVLRRVVKSKKATHAEARRALTRILDLVEILPETEAEAHLTLDLAIALDHSAQDCRYLAAAIAAKVPLVTADENFARKARAAGHDARSVSELPAG